MKIETITFKNAQWNILKSFENSCDADLVTVFGDREVFEKKDFFDYIKKRYPNSNIVGCSSSGNIMDEEVSSAEVVVTAIKFDSSKVALNYIDFKEGENLEELTKRLASEFQKEGLKHLFVLSDGLNINGSKLVLGFNNVINVPVTGGLAGDGDKFEKTLVIANDYPCENRIVAIGLYGDNLTVSSGCYGGWSEFGTIRTITKSQDNILYEIDNEPALDLYKRYLGEYAKELPYSGLRFPLSIKKSDNDLEVIRTLLAIDEEKKSIIFAGDIPEGYQARLMKPNISHLIEGAGKAAKVINNKNKKEALGLVVSCVGRKIVMSQLVDEELEAIAEELGENVQLTGFYSYGEIAPFENEIKNCQLHNQTMTLTVIYED